MEILDQLQAKVRNAVQKIEELQGRVNELQGKVNELEEDKKQYEEKMAGLLQEIGSIDSSDAGQSSEASSEAGQQEGAQSQESLYRHQY